MRTTLPPGEVATAAPSVTNHVAWSICSEQRHAFSINSTGAVCLKWRCGHWPALVLS